VKAPIEELPENSNLKNQRPQSTVLTKLSTMLSQVKRIGGKVLGHPALVASLTVTGLLFAGRQLNLLEPLELAAFDQLIQLRPELPPDQRLLVVKVTEEDIHSQKTYPISDAVMNQLLLQLEEYQPAAIGLDIYRDVPQPPGHDELAKTLQNSDRIIPICKISDRKNPGTPPPPSIPKEKESDRVGFADMAIDDKGVIRRAVLCLTPDPASRCTTPFSFSFQLAQRYLATKGIKPDLIQQDQKEYLKLGQLLFKPLLRTDGGYQQADAGGYQILLNYRSSDSSAHPLARSVTLTDVLNKRLDPKLVKDSVVLIGITASSIGDAFFTPFSSGQRRIEKMPGVVVHAQIVSQILSAVLDGRPLFWFWPEWAEVLWIWGWSFVGGTLVLIYRHPGRLVLVEVVAGGLLSGISVIIFFASGWIPVVAPALGLISATTGVLAYSAYQSEQERLKAEQERLYIEEKAKQQESNLALLQNLLRERTYQRPATETASPLNDETEMPPDDDESTSVWSPQDSVETFTKVEQPKKDPNLLAGHYKINRVLGSGGFGLTYLAQDIHRPGAPQCVVKHLKPAHRDEKFLKVARRLFQTEAEILEKLGNHPQIPRLLAHFEENKEFYLVQEYIQGHPVSDELLVDKRMPEAQVVDLIKSVLEILIFIHEHSVIHRDIKPSNIMRREADGKVVLIDFGAVKQIQPQERPDQEGFTVAIGTRGYAPPEQYAGHPTFSSDIYALGMIGIQALTGIHTHQLTLSETGDVSWRDLANVGKDVSEEFGQILGKMVRYHFAERYQSAAEVLKALERMKVEG
jgi:CHASE2 domain-containing sensor protein/predicted Ser/Thr protein kinase